MTVHGTQSPIVGRDGEIAAIEQWLAGPRPALLEIEGEAGIGKTTLWEEATRVAREAEALVMQCRPVEVETGVSYGALASLLERVLPSVRESVPMPRVRALEGALRLRDVTGSRLDETAVALGALSVIRAAAAARPVVLAVDDVQWLDGSSRVALTYALRNLRPDDDVAVLTTRRLEEGGVPLDLAGSTVALAAAILRPSPLSLGALHRMINVSLGAPLSRPKLVRVYEVSQGNPLHALELARVVAAADPHDGGLTVPASLADALRARIEALSAETRELLLAVAAAGDPRLELLSRLVADQSDALLGEAARHGVLVLDRQRVRFSHPLLASTVYADAGDLARSRIHLRLAELVETPEERARHLALAGTGPDEAVAAALESAAESACRRGARGAGAELYEQAAELTPQDDVPAHDRRLIAAARAHFESGEPDVARSLLEEVAAATSPLRHEALCHLGTLLDETVGGDSSFAAFEEALLSDDPSVQASAHRGFAQALAYVGNLDHAATHADAAVRAAESGGDPTLLVYALATQALVRKIGAHPEWRSALERGLELESAIDVQELDASPSAYDADTRRLDVDLDGARAAYDRMLRLAAERGDVRTEAWCRFGLAAVEIASGRLEQADMHAGELSDLAGQTALFRLPALRTAAHVALLGGDVDQARALLSTVVEEAERRGELFNLRVALQLEGLLQLSLGDSSAAIPPLRRARMIAEQTAVREPSMLIFMLDEVEARCATGDPVAAAVVLDAFEERSGPDAPAWVVPLTLRGRGLVQAAERDLDAAQRTLEEAVTAENDLPLPLERARTRLVLGRVLRRAQRRAASHTTLEEALALFEEVGAPLWEQRTREELARIGGRAPSRDELTPTERRIAELVAEGMTNREVASTLFVTPKTVESALTRVYRKLGVRSRTELARHFSEHR